MFDEIYDQMVEKLAPKNLGLPKFRSEQEKIYNNFCELWGATQARKRVVQFINESAAGCGSDLSEMKRKNYKELKSFSTIQQEHRLIDNQCKKEVISIAEIRNEQYKIVNLFEHVGSRIDQIDTSDILINSELLEKFSETLSDWIGRPTQFNMLEYLCCSANNPLIVTSKNSHKAYVLLKQIGLQLRGVSDECSISPISASTLVPERLWIDFPFDTLSNDEKMFIDYEINFPFQKVGLFALFAGEDPNLYSKAFKRVLRHFVYNNRSIIYIDSDLKVPSDSWLCSLFRNSIKLEIV